MPTFISTPGDEFVVKQTTRDYGSTPVEIIKVDGKTGSVTIQGVVVDTGLIVDQTARDAAAAAEADAQTALTNAAAAQSTANTAETDAQTGITNAAAAQSTANTAVTNAVAAQSTANGAVSVNTTQTANITTLQGQVSPTINEAFFKNYISGKMGATRISFVEDDFMDAVLGAKWVANGTAGLSTALAAGIVAFTVDGDFISKSTNPVIGSPRTLKWAVGGHLATPSTGALNAGEERVLSLFFDSNNRVAVGVIQAVSTTKFAFKTTVGGVTVSALSTVNLANGAHDFVLFWDGTSLKGSIDGETPVVITSLATDLPSNALYERHETRLPSAGMYLDYVFCAAQFV